MKIMYTPVNPNFTIKKVGGKGVYITRTCYHDAQFEDNTSCLSLLTFGLHLGICACYNLAKTQIGVHSHIIGLDRGSPFWI